MKTISRYIMTLVALLAVTTGAWAESKPIGLNVEYAAGDEITSTTDVYVYYGEQPGTLKKMGVKITSTQPLKIFMIDAHGFELNGDAAVYYLPDGVATGGHAGGISCVGESTGDATVVHVASGSGTLTDPYVFGSGPSGTPVPITWDATAKTATIAAMPAGNVTVKVKYFAQAEFAKSIGETPELLAPTAINDVPATTDGAIVKAGTVANIGETETAQGTVMYYAVQNATPPTAPDYDATGWTDKVPTATDFAEGNVYVWYYIKGAEPASGTDRTDANTCSDSEITALGTTGYVTIAAPPTYAVSLKEGTEDADKWTIKPTEAKPGTEIKATYSGTKRVKSVKAVKKAKAASLIVNPVVGQVIGSDGKNYAVDATLPTGVTAVAMIAYVGNGSDCTNGLAIQLNASPESKNWNDAMTYASGLTAVPGGTWRLPSKADWQNMFVGCAKSGDAGASDMMNPIAGFKEKIGATGITWKSDNYWSSTSSGSKAWRVTVLLFDNEAQAGFGELDTSNSRCVLACLAF